MKILLASFLYDTELGGGAVVVLNQLAQLLVHYNYEVSVLTTYSGTQVKKEVINGVKVIHLPASNLYWVANKNDQVIPKKIIWQLVDIWNPLIYRLARKIIKSESPDIVHSHKLRGLSPSIWSAAASAGVKKIIHTCHDFELLSPEGLFMGGIGKLAREQHVLMRPYQNLRRYFSQAVGHVTAPSQFVLNMHTKMGFFPMAQARITPNTHGFGKVELYKEGFDSKLSTVNDSCRHFLFIGRLDKAKGIDLLCQAFSQCCSNNRGLKLRIAGSGPIEELLRDKYKYQKNIEFVGYVFGQKKVELFRDSNALIAPSISPESFGIVIAEAYFYGLPVIASKVGAFPEIVQDGRTGILFEPGSVDALSSAIIRISAEQKLFKTMSANCSKESQKFTTESFLSEYLKIYEDNG